MRTRKHDADCPHLVGRYLPFDARRANAVAYRFGTVCHAVGELHQLTVEVGACGVCVLGRSLAFDMVGCARVSRPFRLVDLDADISHVRFLFLRLYKLVCLCPPVCGHSRTGQAGVSRGVQPRWLIGVFLALASAVREENALISYGFLFPQKPAMVSAVMSVDIGRLFLFASLA